MVGPVSLRKYDPTIRRLKAGLTDLPFLLSPLSLSCVVISQLSCPPTKLSEML